MKKKKDYKNYYKVINKKLRCFKLDISSNQIKMNNYNKIY